MPPPRARPRGGDQRRSARLAARRNDSASRGEILPRIAARTHPDQWGDDELLTLAEAAHFMRPSGPWTARSLRTAADAGQLPATIVARKLLTPRRPAGRRAPRLSPAALLALASARSRGSLAATFRSRGRVGATPPAPPAKAPTKN